MSREGAAWSPNDAAAAFAVLAACVDALVLIAVDDSVTAWMAPRACGHASCATSMQATIAMLTDIFLSRQIAVKTHRKSVSFVSGGKDINLKCPNFKQRSRLPSGSTTTTPTMRISFQKTSQIKRNCCMVPCDGQMLDLHRQRRLR